jgi:hypothetical protein
MNSSTPPSADRHDFMPLTRPKGNEEIRATALMVHGGRRRRPLVDINEIARHCSDRLESCSTHFEASELERVGLIAGVPDMAAYEQFVQSPI